MGENAIKCDCGKLIAVERDGRIFVWCKQCRKEVEIPVVRVNDAQCAACNDKTVIIRA